MASNIRTWKRKVQLHLGYRNKEASLISACMLKCVWNITRESKTEKIFKIKKRKIGSQWDSHNVLYVCTCFFICFHTPLCVCSCTAGMCTYGGQKTIPGIFQVLSTTLLETVSHWPGVGCPVNPRGSSVSCSLKLQACASTPSLFMWALRLKLRSSCLWHKHFIFQ